MAGALIITAEFARADFAWLENLRREHYPAERNRVSAHLTMFHALPPSAEREVRSSLARVAVGPPPKASIEDTMNLGGGVALRVVSADLDRIRSELAQAFHGLLGAQDSGGWRPHVTIQNKVPLRQVHALLDQLEAQFRQRPLAIGGLGLHRYLGGPWERLATFAFRGR